MSNPPAGWYPDPTGQPNTIRWWNGTQWTTKTDRATDADAVDGDTAGTDADPSDATERSADVDSGTDGSSAGEQYGTDDATESAAASTSAGAGSQPAWVQPDTNEFGDQWNQPGAIQAGEGYSEAASLEAGHWTQQAAPEHSQTQQEQASWYQEPTPDPAPNADHWTQQATPERSDWQGHPESQSQAEQSGPPEQAEQGWGQEPTQGWGQEPTQGWGQPTTENLSSQPAPGDPREPAGWAPEHGQGPSHDSSQGWAQQPPQGWSEHDAGRHNPQSGWPDSADAVQGHQGPLDQAGGQWQQSNPWAGATHGQAGFDGPNHQPSPQWQTPGTTQQQFPQPALMPPLSPPLAPPARRTDHDEDGDEAPRSKLPLLIGGLIAAVVILTAGTFFVVNRNDDTADPGPAPTSQPSSPTAGPTPSTSPGTLPVGQSKNPKLHEGARIASVAISYPRLGPPWSDRKRFAPQVLSSSGQYVLLQENFEGKNDWYADIFVGALGTSVLFDGNPKATASDLSLQLRSSLYGNIPVTAKPLGNGPVKRSGKSGWFYQQSITANSTKVTARTLILTVAVFSLGDGTAVAYVSDIPSNRPDLKAAESKAYKGITVG